MIAKFTINGYNWFFDTETLVVSSEDNRLYQFSLREDGWYNDQGGRVYDLWQKALNEAMRNSGDEIDSLMYDLYSLS